MALAPRRELPAPSSKPPAHGQPRCTFGQPSLASSVTNDCPLPLSPSLGGEPSHSRGPRKTGIPRCFRGSSPASAPRPARNGPLFTHSPSRTCLCAPRVTNIVAPPVPLRPTIVSNYPLTPKVALPLPAPRLSSMCRSSTHPTFACSLRTPPLTPPPPPASCQSEAPRRPSGSPLLPRCGPFSRRGKWETPGAERERGGQRGRVAAAARPGARHAALHSSPRLSRLLGLGPSGISWGTSWCQESGPRTSKTSPRPHPPAWDWVRCL